MKTLTLPIAVLLLVIITGCANGKHIYTTDGKCITCWNNPISGKPINHDGTKEKEVSSNTGGDSGVSFKPTEHKLTLDVQKNVDVVYLKLKKEFNYYTEQEIKQEWGSMAQAKMDTFAYAYDAVPSVYYRMRADRQHSGTYMIIDQYIEKTSNDSSRITVTYWVRDESVNAKNMGRSLKSRILTALEK